jgi:two-component system phosphate regulon sensor histidine kinase PhoR
LGHPAAIGWNQLLRRLQDAALLTSIDERLSASLEGVQQKKWEALFNSLSDGIAVCDAMGRVQYGNHMLATLLGKGKDDCTGQPLYLQLQQTCPAADNEPFIERLKSTKGTLVGELKRGAHIADGVLRVSRWPILNEGFEPGSSLFSLRDVTQHKLAEEARNQFVFTATHELRTPLANIKAYAETLSMADDIDIEQQKGFFNIINAEATRLARFVDDLLNVSQMEAGGLTVARHELDLGRLLSEVAEHVAPQAKQKQIQFERVLPPKLPTLSADKDKLAAALVNLLGNAIKYTPDGGQVRLVVEAQQHGIVFHVEDTGIGIAPEELPRLCEKFFRSSDQRVQQITGSGLGLAFSQEVARLHGGRIQVQSELNKGSRFSLELPL